MGTRAANDNEEAILNQIGPACPICGKPQAQTYRPFCSKRCADIDLNRWLTAGYTIPASVSEESDPAEADSIE
jgi:endogenous inhibitor of DNA gyrase (YacG/DUF329 family)